MCGLWSQKMDYTHGCSFFLKINFYNMIHESFDVKIKIKKRSRITFDRDFFCSIIQHGVVQHFLKKHFSQEYFFLHPTKTITHTHKFYLHEAARTKVRAIFVL